MNERLKQLADQALKECDAAKERGIEQYSKRLAELIIRECAAVAYKRSVHSWPSDIFEHFGVKE